MEIFTDASNQGWRAHYLRQVKSVEHPREFSSYKLPGIESSMDCFPGVPEYDQAQVVLIHADNVLVASYIN